MGDRDMGTPTDDRHGGNHTRGTTPTEDAALLRVYITNYHHNTVGAQAPGRTRLLALDAIERLERGAEGGAAR